MKNETDDFSLGLEDLLSTGLRRQLDQYLSHVRIEMVSARYWEVDRHWAMPARRLADTFFFIPTQGFIQAEVAGKVALLGPGQMMIVPESVPHSARLTRETTSFHVLAIHCHFINTSGWSISDFLDEPFASLPGSPFWFEQFKVLTCLMNQPGSSGQHYGQLLIGQLVTVLMSGQRDRDKPVAMADRRIDQAVRWIHEHYDDPSLTVRALADRCRLSQVQFRKLFRQSVGVGPKAYLARHRLKMAAQQLRQTTLSIKEIAYATGFADPHYFYLAFKQQFAQTPTAYRQHSVSEI